MEKIASKGHRALRKGRASVSGQVYLLTTATAARAPVFGEFEMAAAACRVLHAQGGASGLDPLCLVLMPDHLHLLASLRHGRLPSAFGYLKARIAHAANIRRGMTTALWQRGFHDHAVRHEDDLFAMARYIVANPVRAGLVESARLYPFWNAAWL
jgi:REP element-mobilizing transposase RayT